MKIKEGFILRKIADSHVVIPIGNNIADFNGIIALNETAAFLWKNLTEGSELTLLEEALTNEYKISEDLAREDISHFIEKLQQAEMLEEYE